MAPWRLLATHTDDVVKEVHTTDVSLTQFELFYLSVGLHTEEQQEASRRLHQDFTLRYHDDMPAMTGKRVATLYKQLPELFKDDEKW